MKQSHWLIWLILNLVWGALIFGFIPAGDSELMDKQFYILTVLTWTVSCLGCIYFANHKIKN